MQQKNLEKKHPVLRIEIHPRGIKLVDSQGLASLDAAARLRREFHIPVSPLSDKNCLVSRDYAHILLEAFPIGEADWDRNALDIARNQQEHYLSQLRAQLEVAHALENPAEQLKGYNKISDLDSHQIEAVAALTTHSLIGMSIFDEQGTGKTIMALCAFDFLRQRDQIDKLIVICPKSVLSGWQKDFYFLFTDQYKIVTVMGDKNSRRRLILSPYDILLTTYESVIRDQTLLKLKLSEQTTRHMLVVDESYFVKNSETERAQAISELRPFFKRVVVLSGTPAPNSAIDIVNQINIADGGIAFANVRIPKNPLEAKDTIRRTLSNAIYLRRLKEDVFPSIPSKGLEKVTINLQPIQQRMYDETRRTLLIKARTIDDQEFARHLTSFIAQRVALLQICSHPAGIDPLYSEIPAKLLALDNLLRELIEDQDKKVVIWSFFRHSLDAIVNRFNRYGLVRIDGTVSRVEDRMEAINQFQGNPQIRIFVGNAAAAGAGITLTSAHHAIYESFSNQAAHYMQSVDRIHRRGQEHDVTYHVLLAGDTIENREFERLLKKERDGRDLLGDHYDEPLTRERFLEDLGEAL